MNTVVRRFGNDSSRGSAPNRSIYLEDACTPLSDSNRSCRPAPRSLITLFPTNRKDTRNCLCFLTNSISSSLTVPTQETNSFTSNNLFLYFFFFFYFSIFFFLPPTFPFSHTSFPRFVGRNWWDFVNEISWEERGRWFIETRRNKWFELMSPTRKWSK